MKVWITSYALTTGVSCVDAETTHTPSMVSYRPDGVSMDMYAHGEGKDWHRTPELAKRRAEEMRLAKIASLEKSLAKLRKLNIEVPES